MAIASALRMGAEGIKVKVAVVWVVLKLPVQKKSNKVVFHCILSVWILIMQMYLHKPYMVKSVLKYGYVKVKY